MSAPDPVKMHAAISALEKKLDPLIQFSVLGKAKIAEMERDLAKIPASGIPDPHKIADMDRRITELDKNKKDKNSPDQEAKKSFDRLQADFNRTNAEVRLKQLEALVHNINARVAALETKLKA